MGGEASREEKELVQWHMHTLREWADLITSACVLEAKSESAVTTVAGPMEYPPVAGRRANPPATWREVRSNEAHGGTNTYFHV